MKNLYTKAKGKIHPSSSDAPSVLTLLPAAILALTAVLGYEDKEVLAYLITRSLNGPCDAAETEKRRCRRASSLVSYGGGVHAPMFDCGCFECYTSFWIRWDSSPDRELIHQVIEAFEEHLASSEKAAKAKVGRRRERKEKGRSKKGQKEMGKEKNEKEKESKDVEEEEEEEKKEEVEKVEVEEEVAARVGDNDDCDGSVGVENMMAVGDEAVTVVGAGGGGGGERRRSWPDVMGLFNSRLWSLWSPGV